MARNPLLLPLAALLGLAACAEEASRARSAPVPVAPAPMAAPAPAPMAMPTEAPPVAASRARAPSGPDAVPSPDRFAAFEENGFREVSREPVSTFSAGGDTASYNIAKRLIGEGQAPPAQAVRAEEFLNSFPYDYPAARGRDEPFGTFASLHPSPWSPGRWLLQLGVRARDVPAASRPRLNLVFLVDVSGSMQGADRLDLVRQAIRLSLNNTGPADRVSLVTYANGTRVVLDSVPGDRRGEIEAALAGLAAAGGTAGGRGLEAAYDLAVRNFDPAAVNRVVLATDGDFNLGIGSPRELEEFIAARRRGGVYLTTVGVGLGNLTDRTMHALARAGNGTSVYAGSLEDARRALVEDFAANVVPVADDVKFQVEFNPARVSQYRLVGYETRALRREDFDNDRVDAGEVGSGRRVTALYEVVLAGDEASAPLRPLRYAPRRAAPASPASNEFAVLQIRFKPPGQPNSRLMTRPVTDADRRDRFADAPDDARFAAAVAGFAMILGRSRYVGDWSMNDVAETAAASRGADPDGRRAEFASLARLAAATRPAR